MSSQLTAIQVVNLVGVSLSHLVLVVGLRQLDVGVEGHYGGINAPVIGKGIGAVVHDTVVVVVLAHVSPVRVLVELRGITYGQ